MPVHWTLTLRCGTCSAAITYVDERPDWRIDEPEIDQAALAEARAFVERYPRIEWCIGDYRSLDGERVRLPEYVGADISLLRPTGETYLALPEPSERYVACPFCDGKAPISSGHVGSTGSDQHEPI